MKLKSTQEEIDKQTELPSVCVDLTDYKVEVLDPKMSMQEKIAFFTTEMNLTQEEAQNFWPVYNQFCKEEHEAQKLIMTTYKDLNEAIESGTRSHVGS